MEWGTIIPTLGGLAMAAFAYVTARKTGALDREAMARTIDTLQDLTKAQKDTIEEVKMQRDQAFAKLEETRKLLDEQREGRSGDAAQHRAEMEKLTRDFNTLARKLASLENNP